MANSDNKYRLDKLIVRKFPDLSRAQARALVKDEKVQVDGKVVSDTNKNILETSEIKLDDSELKKPTPKINLEILYEDNDCVVINKPAGILTHSKGAYSSEGTVATWLADYLRKKKVNNRDGIVHRLDRATSGVMICAKSDEALKWLQKQFSTRKVVKTYIALTERKIEPREAVIDMPIERNPKHPQTFRVGANGKTAQTAYRTEEYIELPGKSLSLVKLKPKTGRTHQLRVHLSNLGYPIVGDELYGGLKAKRLYLHALSLELTLPSKERMTFSAALPKEFHDPKI